MVDIILEAKRTLDKVCIRNGWKESVYDIKQYESECGTVYYVVSFRIDSDNKHIIHSNAIWSEKDVNGTIRDLAYQISHEVSKSTKMEILGKSVGGGVVYVDYRFSHHSKCSEIKFDRDEYTQYLYDMESLRYADGNISHLTEEYREFLWENQENVELIEFIKIKRLEQYERQ